MVIKSFSIKTLIKENYKFLILIFIFLAYYFSPLSIFFWNWSLMFLVHVFIFPFYVIPEGFFIADGGIVAVPNPITIGIAIFVSLVWIIFFSFLINLVSKKIKLKPIIVFVAIIFTLMIIGGIGEQKNCENEFESYRNKNGEKFLKNIGVIHFVIDTKIKEGLNFFYKLNGLEYISGEPNDSRILARIKTGNESKKICQIKAYRQVYKGVTPLKESDLFFVNNKEYWLLIDPNFCETNQLIEHSKENCLISLEKGFAYKENNDNKEKILPITETYAEDLITFNYPKNWYIFKTDEDDKIIQISKRVDGNFKKYGMIQAVKCYPSVKTTGQQLLEKKQEGKLDPESTFKDIEKVKIGEYEFIKYTESDIKYGFESIHYDTKIGDTYILMISVLSTGYGDYADDMERVIETIKLPDDSGFQLTEYEDDFLKIQYNKNAYTFSNTDSTTIHTVYELKSINDSKQLVRGVIYKGFEESSIDERYNELIIGSKFEKIKLGNYEFIKSKASTFTLYTTIIGVYEISFVLNHSMYIKEEGIEDILKTLVLKL